MELRIFRVVIFTLPVSIIFLLNLTWAHPGSSMELPFIILMIIQTFLSLILGFALTCIEILNDLYPNLKDEVVDRMSSGNTGKD